MVAEGNPYQARDYYPPNHRVVVVLPGDPHHRRVGTVDTTRNVNGDMKHVVRFDSGEKATYWAEDLTGVRGWA